MSDPYRDDNDLNRSYRRGDDTTMWAGILVAALVLMGAVFFFARDRAGTTASNEPASTAPGTSTTRPINKPMPGNPSGTNTPGTTGSAPAR